MTVSNEHLAALIRGLESNVSNLSREVYNLKQDHVGVLAKAKPFKEDEVTKRQAKEAYSMALEHSTQLRGLYQQIKDLDARLQAPSPLAVSSLSTADNRRLDVVEAKVKALLDDHDGSGPRLKAYVDKKLGQFDTALDEIDEKISELRDDVRPTANNNQVATKNELLEECVNYLTRYVGARVPSERAVKLAQALVNKIEDHLTDDEER